MYQRQRQNRSRILPSPPASLISHARSLMVDAFLKNASGTMVREFVGSKVLALNEPLNPSRFEKVVVSVAIQEWRDIARVLGRVQVPTHEVTPLPSDPRSHPGS